MQGDPIAELIQMAIRYVVSKDPSWNKSQPSSFRILVVESWKRSMRVELWHGLHLRWTLPLGEERLQVIRPLFCAYNTSYNPYRKMRGSK